jgi:plastocyanin
MNTIAVEQGRSRGARRWLWVVLAVLLIWPMLGTMTGQGADVPAEDADLLPLIADVVVRDNYFEPSALEIAPGMTVVWILEGLAPHNVVGLEFESPVQTSGVFSVAFADPGSYDYVCTLHRGMHGRVLVAEALK